MSWQRRQWEASNRSALESHHVKVLPQSPRLFRLSRQVDATQATAIGTAFTETARSYDQNIGRLLITSFYRSLSITILSAHDIRRLGPANVPADHTAYLTELAEQTGTSDHALAADGYRASVSGKSLGRIITIGLAVNGVEGRAMQEERRIAADIIHPDAQHMLRPHFPNMIVGTVSCDGFDSDSFKTEFNRQASELGSINLSSIEEVELS